MTLQNSLGAFSASLRSQGIAKARIQPASPINWPLIFLTRLAFSHLRQNPSRQFGASQAARRILAALQSDFKAVWCVAKKPVFTLKPQYGRNH
jgi:hypothetical protein